MNKYFEVVLAGILVFWPMLAASAEEPVRIVVAEQSTSTLAPVDPRLQVDPGPGTFPADDISDRLWNGHLMAGAGLYILKPYFQNNPAFFMQISGPLVPPSSGISAITALNQHDFPWGLDAAPLAWVGYVSEGGFGVRARWWLFDQRSATSAVSDPNTTIVSASPAGLSTTTSPTLGRVIFEPSEMFLNSNLKLNVWDFEATRETVVGRWMLLASAGFRYAHLSQDYNAFQPFLTFHFSFPEPVEETSHLVDLLSAGHNFNGAGPNVALEAKRPMGNSGFSLFANLRGTMLFGQSKQQVARTTITQFGGPNVFGLPPRIDVFVSTVGSVRDVVLPVTELEMGPNFLEPWVLFVPSFAQDWWRRLGLTPVVRPNWMVTSASWV
jgi:hypothetical protein